MDLTDYCSWELSVKLREKGFDRPTLLYYCEGKLQEDIFYPDATDISAHIDDLKVNTNNGKNRFASAPTLWEAHKWLREKYRIYIEVRLWDGGYVTILNGELREISETYEKALEMGITEALKLI